MARTRTTTTRVGAAAASLAVLVAGCGANDAHNSEQVVAAADEARADVDALLAPLDQLPAAGRASADGCYGGQNNWWTTDDYAFRCNLGTALVVPLDPADALSAARAADQALQAVFAGRPGCEAPAALAPPPGSQAVTFHSAQGFCGDVTIEAKLVPAADHVLAGGLTGRPHVGLGRSGADSQLDGPAAAAKARAAGSNYMLLVQATSTYFEKPR